MKKVLISFSALSLLFLFGCKPEIHTHTFSSEWSYDEDYHWHEATCEHTDEVSAESHHRFGEYVSDNNATTESDGTKTRTCKTCGYKNTVTDEGSKIHVHNWGEGVITTQAGCTTEGVKTYTCTCEETKTESIPATGHSFGEYVSDNNATTESDGTKTRTCKICGYTDTVTDAGTKIHVHSWGEGVVTTLAGCTTEGLKTYTCECGETKTESIPATGHTYSDEWKNDENYHWKETLCSDFNDVTDYGIHEYLLSRTDDSVEVNTSLYCKYCEYIYSEKSYMVIEPPLSRHDDYEVGFSPETYYAKAGDSFNMIGSSYVPSYAGGNSILKDAYVCIYPSYRAQTVTNLETVMQSEYSLIIPATDNQPSGNNYDWISKVTINKPGTYYFFWIFVTRSGEFIYGFINWAEHGFGLIEITNEN